VTKEFLTALSVAVVVAAAFLGLARLWQYGASRYRRRTPFAELMVYPPGERFRRPLNRIHGRITLFLEALAVTVVVFVAVYLLVPPALDRDLPEWTVIAMAAFLLLAAAGGGYWGWRLLKRQRRYQFAYDADVAVANALELAAVRGGCVFHHVPAGEGTIIDHVLVAPHGVFVVNVTIRRGRGGQVEYRNEQLRFNGVTDNRPERDGIRKAKWLSQELSRELGHPVRARSVTVVPGWNIHSQGSDDHLLVNERNIAMISGWTRSDTYLMDDETDCIVQYLFEICRDASVRPPKGKR